MKHAALLGSALCAFMAYLSLTLGNDLAAIGWGCATLWAVVCWGLLVEGG